MVLAMFKDIIDLIISHSHYFKPLLAYYATLLATINRYDYNHY